MDWAVVAFIAGEAILLAIAVAIIFDRNRQLDAIRDLTAEDATSDDLSVRVRLLQERLTASEFELDQQVRNASYLADLMGVGILRLDDALRVELANPAAHILLGRAPGSVMGRSAMEAFVDARIEEVAVTARDTGAGSGEFRFRGPDGPVIVVRARRSPVRGVWIVLEDVSELRRLQQIRAEFVDNLSHELRTPLSTISLLAETLARDADAAGPAVPAKMRDRITKIEVETGHLVQMVNELLDLARIESGGPLVLLDDVDMGRVIAELTERLRLFADRQGLRLVTDVPDGLPRVRGDEARIGQVLVNLIHNALKFSDGGGDVTVRAQDEGTELVVSVEDHGVGVPKSDQARIFERFYKVDRARVRGGGTGLGLSIARNVLQQHGGRIWVESEEGVGSTFSFALPIPEPVDSHTERVTTLRVATLNIRNLADRWDERLQLLLADMSALQPDVLGLQEVVYPMQQDRLIGAAGQGRYETYRAWAGRPEYGNAMLVRQPLTDAVSGVERLELGLNRSALRLVLRRDGSTVLLAATHLHHVPADEAQRDDQARQLLEWLAAAPPTDAQVVVGDFNAEPDEPAIARIRSLGFRSAHAEANGADPDVTWPSGLQAPGMDTDGEPGCLDYIWIRGAARVASARLAFDRPAVADPTLYASDHLGLVAELELGEGG